MNNIEFSLCEAIKTSHKDNRNPIDDNAKRIFKMASYINCNGEILKNIHIKKYMEKIMYGCGDDAAMKKNVQLVKKNISKDIMIKDAMADLTTKD